MADFRLTQTGQQIQDILNQQPLDHTTLDGHVENTTIHVTSGNKTAWNAKYDKPAEGIPSSDFAQAVQTALTKALSAYQKPNDGIPASDLAAAVQTAIGKAMSAYQKPGSGIPSSDFTTEVQNALVAALSAYQKPNTGIPQSDLAAAVQAVLISASNEPTERQQADAALQLLIQQVTASLVNYYLKSETYSRAEVNELVNAVGKFQAKIVSTLPTPSIDTTGWIYMLPSTNPETQNVKEEYITVLDGSTYKWEHIGSTNIDLSPYSTTEQMNAAISTALQAYTTTENLTALLAQKQDVISDLATIRSGAQAGATAVQPSALNDYYNKSQIDSKVTDINAAIGTKASQTDLTAEINRAETAEAQIRADLSTMNSVLTLEANSNPAFKVSNHAAADAYIGAMGGYGLIIKDGKAYAAKLNGDWSGFMDGTPITDASKFETMIHVPKCNFKGNGKTLTFGGLTPIDGGKSFDSPEWVGAYEMYVDGNNKGHSRPGVAPAHSKTMSQFWACAQALGTEFGLANYQFFCLINALFQAKYGNLNSQAIIGAGGQTNAWDSWRDVPMGLTKALGDGSGRVLYNDANVGDQYAVKLFGFEDLWGKLWEFRPGIRYYMDGDVRHAVVYPGNQVSNTAEGRDISGVLASAGGQYATQMLLGEYWDMICQAVGGGDTTYYCDGYWAATGGELLGVGGSADHFARCGVAYSDSDPGFSISWTSFGSRLAFYGTPQIVSGAELLAMAD